LSRVRTTEAKKLADSQVKGGWATKRLTGTGRVREIPAEKRLAEKRLPREKKTPSSGPRDGPQKKIAFCPARTLYFLIRMPTRQERLKEKRSNKKNREGGGKRACLFPDESLKYLPREIRFGEGLEEKQVKGGRSVAEQFRSCHGKIKGV